MKRLIIILLSLLFVTGCGKKKEEVSLTKSDGSVKQNAVQKTDTITGKVESNKDEEEESKPLSDENTSSGIKNSQEYLSLKTTETASKVGSRALVKGYVADVVIREKVAYLNFDGKYPKNTFTAVIFPEKYEVFGDLMSYKNKTVEVKGKIGTYGGKPQIILNNKNQIRVIN